MDSRMAVSQRSAGRALLAEVSMTEDEARQCYHAMTELERRRVAKRFDWFSAAFDRPIAAWIHAVEYEVCAIAANLPPDIGE
jgi:hypothetical protein